jgi:hypothetical protein
MKMTLVTDFSSQSGADLLAREGGGNAMVSIRLGDNTLTASFEVLGGRRREANKGNPPQDDSLLGVPKRHSQQRPGLLVYRIFLSCPVPIPRRNLAWLLRHGIGCCGERGGWMFLPSDNPALPRCLFIYPWLYAQTLSH